MSIPGGNHTIFRHIRESQGSSVLRHVRRYLNIGTGIGKHRSHLSFNHTCLRERILPSSLKIKAPVNSMEGKEIARKFGFQFLQLRIRDSHSIIKKLEEKKKDTKEFLQRSLPVDVLKEVESYMEKRVEDVKNKNANCHMEKLNNIRKKEGSVRSIDKSRWVVNMSQTTLTPIQNEVLELGLNFSTVSSRPPLKKILSEAEAALARLPEEKANLARNKLTLTFRNQPRPAPNLNKDQRIALKELKENKEITILKADKGNSTVVLTTSEYDAKMKDLLDDQTTYRKLKKDPTAATERKVAAFVWKLRQADKIGSATAHQLRNTDSSAPALYGLPKIHKEGMPFRPIVSFIGSPTYDLAKFISRILSPLVGNTDRSVRNSKEFVEEIRDMTIQDNEMLVSFDVVSLFTNVPVDLALTIARKRLEADDTLQERTSLTIDHICEALTICLTATNFSFRGEHYQQIFGTAMGSSVSVVVANLVMEDVEERALTTFIDPPRFWKRYMDDTSCIIDRMRRQEFFNHLNSIEKSIQFTMEEEEHNSIAFLDVKITRQSDQSFATSIFRKKTHTNRYLNFNSNHPNCHKRSVVNSLFSRVRTIVSDPREQKKEMNFIKKTLRDNGYPKKFLTKQRKRILDEERPSTVGFATIPYVKGFSEKIKRILEDVDIKVAFKPQNKIGQTLSTVKDQIDPKRRKGVVYSIPCKDCNEVYIGETKRSFTTRSSEHQRDIEKGDEEKSALSKHAIHNDHRINWKEARILEREEHYKKRLFLESFHINSTKNSMNDKKTCMFPSAYRSIFYRP